MLVLMLAAPRCATTGQQLLKVTAADGTSDDYFGRAVAISSDGTRIAVGTWGDDDGGSDSGSLYVLDGATGTTLLKVTPADGAEYDWFGTAVAISSDGTRIAVGTWGDDDGGSESGSVYVLDGATGSTMLKVTAADGAEYDWFGNAVAISSDGARIAVGAYYDDDRGSYSGSVYVLDGATGTTLLKVTAADGAEYNYFGIAVAISSDGARIAVGAYADDDGGSNSGSVYVLDGATATTLLKVTAADGAADDMFGTAVAISSDGARIAVGAPELGGSDSGSVYVGHQLRRSPDRGGGHL